MKYASLILMVLSEASFGFRALPQDTPDFIGAWKTTIETDSGRVDGTLILMDGYMSTTYYSVTDKKFYQTSGGSWEAEDNELMETYEFHTDKPSSVGRTETFDFLLEDDMLMLDGKSWERIDDGSEYDLAGAWLITGRKRDGEVSRSTPGARKTMKILSGTRFQWIAYHTETGEFFGTGGGTYSTKDGKYTENIDFFSRDGSRVGASLEFDYKIEDKEWHHSGLSSKGDPIYEVWTPRYLLEQ